MEGLQVLRCKKTMPAKINYLRLDASFDPVFDPTAQLSDINAVAQAIDTRLLLFQGEWWEDLNEGTPMFQKIMGQRSTPKGLQIMSLALSARVAGAPYVSGVKNVSISFDDRTRAFSFRCEAQTSFGTISVVFEPGLSARIN